MQTSIRVTLAACCVWAAWVVGVAGSDNGQRAQEPPRHEPLRPVEGVSTDGQFRGLAIQLHGGREVYEHYHQLIPEIAALGADTVMFVVHGWQMHAGSLDLHVDPYRSADDAALGQLLDLAAVHGMRRILMPVVLLKAPRTGEWRGKIIPPGNDWDAWFDRYRQFIGKYARLAEKHHVELLMVGSELIKSERQTAQWRETIASVRNTYSGALGYSANWDHYQTTKIGFWDDLDVVGMTSYYKLADGPNPRIEELDRNWSKIKKEILAFQRQVNRPIVFTEVGWCSQEGAAKEGWNYFANEVATDAGQREQAILYESFMKTWTHEPAVKGIIWWEWSVSAGGAKDYGYTPKGKLAETYLKLWLQNKPRPKSRPDSTVLRTAGE
jgi:Glycoside Hydrolase Family 113